MYDLFLIIQISGSYFSKKFKLYICLFLISCYFYHQVTPILNKKTATYLYLFFISLICSSIYGQKRNHYQLKITSITQSKNHHISTIKHKQNFLSDKELKKTKDSVLSILKEKGFYTLKRDSLIIKNKKHTYYIDLGKKIDDAVIKTNPRDDQLLKSLNLKLKDNQFTINIEDLKNTITLINNKLTNNGRIFSKVKLSNIIISNSKLSATLDVSRSKKRKIDKIIIKGYAEFPKSFLKNYFNISSPRIINSKLIEEISNKTNQLDFIKEVKKPEILFSNDSTIIYMYINKVKANYFDGLVNFNSENKKIKFRGYFDLNLKNTFNKGEEIKVHWRNNGNNKQELNLKSSIPYIIGTKISSSVSFNLYKHDSTYINTKANFSVFYTINNNLSTSFITENEISKTSNKLIDIDDYRKLGFGFGIYYKKNKSTIALELFRRSRNTTESISFQELTLKASTNINLSKKITFIISNTSKFTSYKTKLSNELYRSGGANSIRGFQENSILSNAYSYMNSELRFNTNSNSYIYSLHDLGVFNINNSNNIFKSIGLGYQFTRGNSKININAAFNGLFDQNYLGTSIISIKMLTHF